MEIVNPEVDDEELKGLIVKELGAEDYDGLYFRMPLIKNEDLAPLTGSVFENLSS